MDWNGEHCWNGPPKFHILFPQPIPLQRTQTNCPPRMVPTQLATQAIGSTSEPLLAP